jgi:3'(2'), 5'-bisphosphate nucleotidase
MQKSYRDLLLEIALEAGAEIMKYFKTGVKTCYKEDDSPLTLADIAANKIITERLKITNVPLISEESENAEYEIRKNYNEFWLIDPIDGTKQFISNDDEFTVNIARIVNNSVYEGIVFAPAKNLIYYGNINSGSVRIITKENEEKTLPCEKTHNKTLVASKSHLNDETLNYIKEFKKQFPQSEILHIGSSLKLCCVAEGRADIYPRLGPINEWDIAAGHAVLKSAGGDLYNMHTGKPLRYNSESLKTPDFVGVKLNKLR